MKKISRGFTLIELMIVVAIIGILATIAIPKFAELMRKSAEGASKGNLGSVRGALGIYYGDLEGQYPDRLAALTVSGRYLSSLPAAKTPNYHGDTSAEGDGLFPAADGSGGWWYDNVIGDANAGSLKVNCTHTDTKGTIWTTY